MSSGAARFLYRSIRASSPCIASQVAPVTSVTTTTGNTSCTSGTGDIKQSRGNPEAFAEIKGVIFDMDGTLTIPVLNFLEMRKRLNLSPEMDILPTVLKLPPEEKARAMEIIKEFEVEGSRKLQLQPGLLDLLQFVAESGVKRAVMTRNSMVATQVFLDKLHVELSANSEKYPQLSCNSIFSEILTREFQPCKPDPTAVFHICQCWSLEPREVVIVGDDKTDMICGRRAGAGVTILLKNERNHGQENYEDFAVDSLSEIITLFSTPLTISRKE